MVDNFADATKVKEEQREKDRVSAATMTCTQAAQKYQTGELDNFEQLLVLSY